MISITCVHHTLDIEELRRKQWVEPGPPDARSEKTPVILLQDSGSAVLFRMPPWF